MAGLHSGGVVLEGHAEGGGALPAQLPHRQAVGAVGGDLKLKDHVVHAEGFHSGGAGSGHAVGVVPLVQHQNAVLDGVGEVVNGQAQLAQAAQHAAALHAAQHALFDLHAAGQLRAVQRHGHKVAHLEVGRAGDDLQRSSLPHFHLADDHVVGVRMGHDGLNAADDHVFHRVGGVFVALHLAAGHGEPVGHLLGGAVKIGEFLRPVHG